MDSDTVITFGAPLALLMLGLFVGRARERKHFQQLKARQAQTQGMLLSDLKIYAGSVDTAVTPTFVTGEAVIATDYAKNLFASLRNIVGGEVHSFLSLATRARQEALQRMVEQAREIGCDAVCNVRIDAADIGGNTSSRGVPMVAMIASGTAYRRSTS